MLPEDDAKKINIETTEKPLAAKSYFWISNLIIQVIKFSYYDKYLNYFILEKNSALEEQLDKIRINMQYYIDEDSFYLNNTLIPVLVDNVRLEYLNKQHKYPILIFRIRAEKKINLLTKQKNTIDLIAEPEKIDYPVHSEWIVPKKIFDVQTGMIISKISGNKLILEAKPDMIIGGEERITFY